VAKEIATKFGRTQEEEDASRVCVSFWRDAVPYPGSNDRFLDTVRWRDISRNYSSATRKKLDRLMSVTNPSLERGRLMLWQGRPGTGNTYALRALASEFEADIKRLGALVAAARAYHASLRERLTRRDKPKSQDADEAVRRSFAEHQAIQRFESLDATQRRGPVAEKILDSYWKADEVKNDYERAAALLGGADPKPIVERCRRRVVLDRRSVPRRARHFTLLDLAPTFP